MGISRQKDLKRARHCHRTGAWFTCMLALCTVLLVQTVQAETAIWLTRGQILEFPMQGPAWDALVHRAHEPISAISLADQDSPDNVTVLAMALYAVRTGDEEKVQQVRNYCRHIQGTERGARVLAVGRELVAYVLAADLVGLDAEDGLAFRRWLTRIRDREFFSRTLRSTHEDRPNNWGTHAGATRLAIALYLEDTDEIERSAEVFRGWLGEADGWRGFEFGETWWQPRGFRNYGINPAGAMRNGHLIDGVLPDDQRRGGQFRWPPPRENYVYEALQGAVTQALLLEKQGYDVWEWGDKALLRAFRWLNEQADFPAVGDDTWMPHVINRVYGTRFPAPRAAKPGKGMGFTDWTQGH